MTYFSWKKFCDERRIPYVERGPNTARNHISIRCPFCGAGDPSEHMGLHLDPRDPKWGCFRGASHRGRDPAYLVQALLGCTPGVARMTVDAQKPETDAFEETVQRLLYPPATERGSAAPARALEMPREFKPLFGSGSEYARRFFRYLRQRGFGDLDDLAEQYDLRYCLAGRFRNRLIIPLYDCGELVGWTGRAINPAMSPRYLTLSREEGALADADSFVWQRRWVERGKGALVIVEGPMDAIKVDWYLPTGRPRVVTCLFGKPKARQVDFLVGVARRYERIVVALDRDAYADSMRLASQLSEVGGSAVAPPLPAPDPGSMAPDQILELLEEEPAMR